MIMTATQFNRHCQNFITLLQKSQQFDGVKSLLNQWRQKNKPAIGAIDTFMNMAKLFQQDQDLVEQFNKCLVKQATIQKKPSTNLQVKQLAMQNQKSGHLLDMVLNWIKNDQQQQKALPAPILPAIILPQIVSSSRIQQLSQQQFLSRLQSHRFLPEISKILSLYRRCIITLKQFKQLINPIYSTQISVFNMMYQYAQQSQTSRRKVTIFAPLTDLVDDKYPVEQVGNSYIIIPDGYANYSNTWAKNPLEKFMNRICCSVPLGSEGTFIIARKNQFEQQLFKSQQQKYQIDQNICMIKSAISKIQNNKNLNTPLLQKLLAKIYPIQNVFNIMLSQPLIAKNIILPRLYQKLQQLTKCKLNFKRQCEQVAIKNFSKSLDYRCFYFRKNDKKYNSTQRWQKQIQLRKIQIQNNVEEYEDEINDRQALQTTRCYLLNTFNNITKEQILEQKKIDILQYDKKQNSIYPQYPNNQILFIMGFDNDQVFNDMLEIILYHCQKKSIFELIILKIFKKIIRRNLIKDASILSYIDIKAQSNLPGSSLYQNNQNSNTNNIQFTNNNSISQPLNQPRKDRKIYKDITQQFIDFIQQQIDPLRLQQMQNPFEGPNQHTFIGTKTLYNLVRYLLTIYQRFFKAKELSDSLQKNIKKQCESSAQQEITLYQQFLSILIFKIKDTKQLFQQYLRKIMNQQTFIYFTLDKFILSLVKLINNINNDSLTFKLLKDQTKDYQMGVKKWTQYQFQSITQQLTRIYNQSQSLFRFTFTQKRIMYVSMWENKHMNNNNNNNNNNNINSNGQNKDKDKEKEKEKEKNNRKQIVQKLYEQTIDYITESSRLIKNKYNNYKIMNYHSYNHNYYNNHNHNHKNKTNHSTYHHNNKKQLDQKIEVFQKQQSEYMNLHEGVVIMKGEDIILRLKRSAPSLRKNKEDIECVKQLDRLKKFIKKV